MWKDRVFQRNRGCNNSDRWIHLGGAGTISTATTSGAITVNGSFSETGGSLAQHLFYGVVSALQEASGRGGHVTSPQVVQAKFIWRNFSFAGGTIALGAGTRKLTLTGANAAMSTGVAFTGGANTTLIFNRAISAQNLTTGIDVHWPGNLNLNNTFPATPTFNLITWKTSMFGGNGCFSAGGATGGVNLNDNTLFIKGATFTNNSGYTGTANGFVSMQGSALQIISGSGSFFDVEVWINATALTSMTARLAAVTFGHPAHSTLQMV